MRQLCAASVFRFLILLSVVLGNQAAWATQTGGLAELLGVGGVATSVTWAFADQTLKGGAADSASSFRTLVRGEFGVLEDLDLYVTGGISDLTLDGGDFRKSRGVSLGVGTRYSLVKSSDGMLRLVMNLEGEYFKISNVRRQAYQAGVYVIQQYGTGQGYFFPFGGARVSYSRYEGKEDIDNYKGKNLIGVFGGADYFVGPNVFFSGEVHLFDEWSVCLTTGYRF